MRDIRKCSLPGCPRPRVTAGYCRECSRALRAIRRNVTRALQAVEPPPRGPKVVSVWLGE